VLDREFRSFVKPNKIDIRFDMADPGELHYVPHISDHKEEDEGDTLFDLLANGMSLTTEEISDTLGIPAKQVKSRVSKLVEEKKIEEVSKGVYRIKREANSGESNSET
jgi:predicted transcriptional regulator of viral defense system